MTTFALDDKTPANAASAPRPDAGSGGSPVEQRHFAAAAHEFMVPESVLLGVSYQESLWDAHRGEHNTIGGYGPMGLTDLTASMAHGSALASLSSDASLHTLTEAAALTGAPADRVRADVRENIRAGAALLASYEKQLTGGTPSDPDEWFGAVARYSGSPNETAAGHFARHVFERMRTGVERTTADGQWVRLAAQPSLRANTGQLAMLHLKKTSSAGTECPPDMDCRLALATTTAYQVADRPTDGMEIKYIVIHDAESSYQNAIAAARAPGSKSAANYVMRAFDGAVTQTVADKNLALHANNFWFGMHSIGIEHEGFAARGATWYTQAQYQNTADLVRYLARKYGIPLDRQHILGHDNVPGPLDAYVAGMHWDPGPYWDWDRFMMLAGAKTERGKHGVGPVGTAVTIAPDFAHNEQTVKVCANDDPTGATTACTEASAPSNLLYVRTAPSASAPLAGDPYVHHDGSAGTKAISDWSSTVCAGQQFVVADREGDWTGIWYGGRKVWFDNPKGRNTIPAEHVKIVRPAGGSGASVFGMVYPDASEYPSDLEPGVAPPLNRYTLPTGQAYVATQPPVHPDDFISADDRYVRGAGEVYTIQYNHRVALVRATEISVS
ncbi:N-acetylmuramoyl-L-alanine amidase [Streptomyces sp. NPDC003393]